MKKIIEVIPALSIVSALFGYAKLYSYYSIFGVDISNYIEFSEILMLLLPAIAFLMAIVASMFSIWLLYINVKIYFLENVDYVLPTRQEIERMKVGQIVGIVVQRKTKKSALLVYSTITIILLLPAIIYTIVTEYSTAAGYYPWLIIVILFAWNIRVGDLEKIRYPVILFVFFIIYKMWCAYYIDEACKVLENGSHTYTAFQIDNKVVQSTDSFTYIGGTHDYVMIYDRKRKITSVYKKDDMTAYMIMQKP